MAERRHPKVVNVEEVEARTMNTGSKFGSSMKHLGQATGARGIGCTLYEVEPGRAAFPHHFHCQNEESIYILEGSGTMRIGKDEVPVRAGDYITFNPGPDHAHQLRNTGSAKIRYLCFSTLSTVEAVGYPDSKKIGVAAAPSYEAALKGGHWMRQLHFEGQAVQYFDGEDVG